MIFVIWTLKHLKKKSLLSQQIPFQKEFIATTYNCHI